MKNLRTIILAAGKGVRMKSDTPKVLHPVCGKPMLQYILDVAKAVGSLKTYVILGPHNRQVEDILEKTIKVVLQKRALGTADAVKTVESHLRGFSGDVLIVCGDTPMLTKESIKELVLKHKKTQAACTVMTTVVLEPRGYGRIIR